MSRPRTTRADDREIARLAIPAFGALVAEPLYILADTAVVGHLGTRELAGLAVASTALLTGFALCIFLAYGTTASIARRLGAGDEAGALHEAVQGLWLALLVSAPLVAGGLIFGDGLVHLLGARGDIAGFALEYLRISLAGAPALLLGLTATGWLRGKRDMRTPLAVAVVTNIVNLVLEIVLIPGLGYGIGASALATVVAQWLGAAVYVRHVLSPALRAGVSLTPDPVALLRMGRTARDLILRTAALRGSLTLATAVAARIGTVEVAAHQIAYEVWSFLALALDAVAIAGQTLVGGALGAGQSDRAGELAARMIRLAVYFGVVCGVAVLASRGVLGQVFTGDERVSALAGFLLGYVGLLQPLSGYVFALDGILIGAGDQHYLAGAMTGAAVVMVLGAAAVLGWGLGIGWLWATMAGFMAARGVGLWLRYRSGEWRVTGAVRG